MTHAPLLALKGQARRVLHPLVGAIADRGITANHVTVATIAGCLLAGSAFVLTPAPPIWWLWPVVAGLRLVGNVLDGLLAQERGQATRLGAALNTLGDPIADAALTLPLLTVPGVPALGIAAFVALSGLVEHAGAAVGGAGEGPLAKPERLVFLLPLVVGAARGEVPPVFAAVWLTLGGVGLVVTLVRRVVAGLEE